jgi:hypothetical protein
MECRQETQDSLCDIKDELSLTQEQKDNLSDGSIDEEEFAIIQEEF